MYITQYAHSQHSLLRPTGIQGGRIQASTFGLPPARSCAPGCVARAREIAGFDRLDRLDRLDRSSLLLCRLANCVMLAAKYIEHIFDNAVLLG